MKNIYIIRKYVVATSVKDAIRKERKAPIHEVFVDDASQKKMVEDMIPKPKVGFKEKK